ncbi:hypothetical protein PKCBPO_01271 [Methylorubrum thiocyanatum]|jgi:hypothetical protein|uniref:Uncharacterized protein n=1 Tax=Methylorubrum thiocyanatum TaxID=47958 RepID=A0AA40RY46_9HYPH|nr:hypothetical protein [Methylorubrum thiocyanatum]GJE82843.1 hypothetical protein CJNNKLLH_4210 [Methylorubrum thiocyanatum]
MRMMKAFSYGMIGVFALGLATAVVGAANLLLNL